MRYFAYGMNLDLDNMPHGTTLIGPGILHGWRYDFRMYADVQPDPSEITPGLVLDITEYGLSYLDQREGYRGGRSHNFYNRLEVPVKMLTGETVEAIVYTMAVARDLDPPDVWYLGIIERALSEHGLPEAPMKQALLRAGVEA